MSYEKNFDEVLTKIEKARVESNEHNIVNIVAVSKYVTTKEIKKLYEVGQRAFGENKVQDLKQKSLHLEELPLEWHFIGRLQKNKINHLIDLNPYLVHSIHSLELANEIDKRLKVKNKKLNALLQINSANEDSKAGVSPKIAKDAYHQIQETCSNITLQGVMTIGAHTNDQPLVQKSFETTHNIFESLQKNGAKYCSMGMSSDFELAIKCGSNMLRLGSVLF
jgi:pyridoxal phosphate enzyme (YggS family)